MLDSPVLQLILAPEQLIQEPLLRAEQLALLPAIPLLQIGTIQLLLQTEYILCHLQITAFKWLVQIILQRDRGVII